MPCAAAWAVNTCRSFSNDRNQSYSLPDIRNNRKWAVWQARLQYATAPHRPHNCRGGCAASAQTSRRGESLRGRAGEVVRAALG